MSPANAALTPKARLKVARLVVDDLWPIARAAKLYDVSWPTAKRWADRYRVVDEAGMDDRSSRPHHRPNRLSHIDRVTGEPIRRCEHPHPGSMLHVDVTKVRKRARRRRPPLRRPPTRQKEPGCDSRQAWQRLLPDEDRHRVSITTHVCDEYVAKLGERAYCDLWHRRKTEDAVAGSRDAK